MAIIVPLRETSGLVEIARALITVIRALGSLAEAKVIAKQSIGTSSTRIAHGQKNAPRYCFGIPHGDFRVFVPLTGSEPTRPDATHVFLQASAACTADVVVIP